MPWIRLGGLVLVSWLCGAEDARAVDGTISYGATITGTCILNVTTNGSLGPNGTLTELSSTNPGGISGTVTALTTGVGFDVQVVNPTGFSAAPSGIAAPNFSTSFTGSGVTAIGATAPGTTRTLAVGLTTLTVDLTADLGGSAFPNGTYAADVIVRCL